MANERDEDQFNERKTGSDKERGQQGESGQETRTSGQPIGGNESNTGTGTTMSQGFDSSAGAGSAGAAGSDISGVSSGSGGSTSQSGSNESGAQGTSGQADQASSGGGETETGERGQGGAGGAQGGGFVGSQGEESGEYLQDRDPQQAGFAEHGRGAPDEGRDVERGGERSANRDSDIEGSSNDS